MSDTIEIEGSNNMIREQLAHLRMRQKQVPYTMRFYRPTLPEYTPDLLRNNCEVCSQKFSVLRRKHHCRNCGKLVCNSCSQAQWPAAMVPRDFNLRKENWLRVCHICHKEMESFRILLLKGKVQESIVLYESRKFLHLFCPYQIYHHKMYPIHCAASGGSKELVMWLCSKGANILLEDAFGWTPMDHCVHNGHTELLRWMVVDLGIPFDTKIKDIASLWKCLDKALKLPANVPPPDNDSPPEDAAPPEDVAPPEVQHTEQATAVPIALVVNETPSHGDTDESMVITVPTPLDLAEEQLHLRLALEYSSTTDADLTDSVESNDSVCECTKNECLICFDKEVEVVLVPCGHFCFCTQCAAELTTCPVCRSEIEQVVKTFTM